MSSYDRKNGSIDEGNPEIGRYKVLTLGEKQRLLEEEEEEEDKRGKVK